MKLYTPFAIILISIIEIVFFVLDVLQDSEWSDFQDIKKFENSTVHGFFHVLFRYDPSKRSQAWRFVTSMFAHADVMHIMGNVILQIILGVPLELIQNWWRVSLIYIAGVLAGTMSGSIAYPDKFGIGASAGVCALETAHFATIILNWKDFKFIITFDDILKLLSQPITTNQIYLYFSYSFYIYLQLFVLGLYGYKFAFNIYKSYINDNTDNISHVGHLCGEISGLLIGLCVLRNINVRSWQKKLRWFGLLLYLGLMSIEIYIHICNPEYFYQNVVL